MNDNEIDDALDALKRLEKSAKDLAQTSARAAVAVAGVRVDADLVRECIDELRKRPANA